MLRTTSLLLLAVACSSGTSGTSTTITPKGSAAQAPADAAIAQPLDAGSASTPALPANGVKVTLTDVGLEASSLDRTADPCTDFYQFACGGWIANHKIPADRARWGRFAELDEKNLAALKSILEEAAKGLGGDPATKKFGDYYAACMDEPAIERGGIAAIKPLLAKTMGVKDGKTWLAAVTELHQLGTWVVWRQIVAPDSKDSNANVTWLTPAGIQLPDRDYYAKPQFAEKLAAYQAHVGRMLVLAGVKQPTAAADVIAIETEIARLMKSRVELRDPYGKYNPLDRKLLAKQVKSVDWKAYFGALDKASGGKATAKLIVTTPNYFKELDKVRAKFKPAQWASYFTYHAVADLAYALPKAFEDEAFELEKALSGVEQAPDRAKRCNVATQRGLGELLGQQFTAKYFPATSKQTAVGLVDALVKRMGEEIGKLAWMSEPTRQVAAAKLGKVVRMVGYPEKWKTYDFVVKRDDFAGNALRHAAYETKRMLGKAGKPVDRAEWQMNTFQVNAYYEETANHTALPAGILQGPFFGQDRSVAANLGGIGMVIGHELTHGFDDTGARYDGDGNLLDWWKPEDKRAFEERGKCVSAQYSGFEAMPKGFVNGDLTLGENIADLGGVKMAFGAYRTLREAAPQQYIADGFTEDQQYFLAVAQAWCSQDRPAEVQRRLASDSHSPPKFRVYGALRNMKEFAEAFRCSPGTPMHPAKTCSVW